MRILFPLNPYNQQRQYEKPVWVYPAHLAMYATHLKNQGHDVVWGHGEDYKESDYDMVIEDDFDIHAPFADLPYPDRVFTDAKNPRWQSYGNYKFHPATHMMASNLCWYGKCTFCIDTEKLKSEKRGLRTVDHVMEEIDDLIRQGYKEVFDDSGTFPVGKWLEEFCRKMQKRKKYIKIGCNMKPVSLDYKMMADAGFRFILVGVESANQKTLDTIKKGQRADQIVPIIKSMADAGLEPHTTWMSSYPFETKREEQNSVDMCNYLLRKGYSKTAQVSIYMPPRTAPKHTDTEHKRIRQYFHAYKHPEFWYNKIKDIRRLEDITYLIRGAKRSQSIFEDLWRKICRGRPSKLN